MTNKLKTIEDALRRIIKWHGEFPSTGKVWECSGEPMSYGACYGSNGERDYMRSVANQALADLKALQETHVLVPREPTEVMIDVGTATFIKGQRAAAHNAFKAMRDQAIKEIETEGLSPSMMKAHRKAHTHDYDTRKYEIEEKNE